MHAAGPRRDPELEETFAALRRVMAVFRGRFAGVLREHGLTFPQWMVLKSLKRKGRLTVGDLADACEMTAANMTGILDRLEAANLVTRAKSPEDRRVVHVRMTEIGHEKVESVFGLAQGTMSALFEGWSEQELRELRGMLGRLQTRPDDQQDF